MNLSRRGFLSGLGAAFAAPAIVKAASIMPVKAIRHPLFDVIDAMRAASIPAPDYYTMIAHPRLFRDLQNEINGFASARLNVVRGHIFLPHDHVRIYEQVMIPGGFDEGANDA